MKPSRKKKTTNAAFDVDNIDVDDEAETRPVKKPRKIKEYVPVMRSGPYAIIKVLGELEQNSSQAITKADLIDRAQQHCDASFTVPGDATKFYTAWKSMDTLMTKELVYTRGHPAKKYALTDEGWRVALKMQIHEQQQSGSAPSKSGQNSKTKESKSVPTLSKVEDTEDAKPTAMKLKSNPKPMVEIQMLSESEEEKIPPQTPLSKLISIKDSTGSLDQKRSFDDMTALDPIKIRPGTFEIHMLLDNREIRTTRDRDYIAKELRNKYDIMADVRPLPLGDVLWVARMRPPHCAALKRQNIGDSDEGSSDIVLDHIVERKRLDDLISSLRDGRLHEQKFRLKRSGMKHVTYLIETITISAERQEVFGQSIDSTIAQMQIVDDIFVKQTAKLDDTIKYLARMTKALKKKYESQELYVLPSRGLDIATHWKTVDQLHKTSPSKVFGVTFSAYCSLCAKSDSLTLRDQFLKFLMCIHGLTGDRAIQIQKIWPTPRALIDAYTALGDNVEAKNNMISDRLGMKIDRKRVTKNLSTKIADIWAT